MEQTTSGRGVPATTAEALKAVTEDVRRLVRAEIALAKAEMAAQASARGAAIGMLAAAGLLGLFVLFWLTYAMFAGWSNLVPAWAAALLTVLVLAVVAGILVVVARRILREPMTPPERAAASAQASVALVRDRLEPAVRPARDPSGGNLPATSP